MKRVLDYARKPLWFPLRAGAVHISVRNKFLILAWFFLTGLAYQTGRDLFFRTSYLILVVFVFSFLWAAYSVLTFHLQRRVATPRTRVGQIAEEIFFAHNTGRLTKIWIEIVDQSELPMHRVSRVLNSLSPRARWSFSVRTLCRRRGHFHLGPITVACGDPFGLFLIQRRMPNTTGAITVYPLTVDLPTFAPPTGHLPGGDALRRRTQQTTTNVSGTREYAPGDSFSRIHWRSTARMERLIVKEFELDPAADVWIFLDMERGVQAGRWVDQGEVRDLSELWIRDRGTRLAPNTEEYDVTVAASVAKYFLRNHRSVGFVTYGHHREVVQPDRGERQLNRLLDVLAVIRAEGNIPFAQILATESTHLQRNITLVAITPSTELGWVKSVRELKRRGVHTIAVVADVNSFGGRGETRAAVAELLASGIATKVVREGKDLREALTEG